MLLLAPNVRSHDGKHCHAHLEGLRCSGGSTGTTVAEVGVLSTGATGTSAVLCSAATCTSPPDCSEADPGRCAFAAATCVLVDAAEADGSAAACAACLNRFRGGTDSVAAFAAAVSDSHAVKRLTLSEWMSTSRDICWWSAGMHALVIQEGMRSYLNELGAGA